MTDEHLERIIRQAGTPDLVDLLAQMPGSDLQTLLLAAYRKRAARKTPAQVLQQYRKDRFVKPSAVDPRSMLAFDGVAFEVASERFEPIELSPVCPLGTSSSVATVSQDKAVATLRNTEVLADPTNLLALECSTRRRTRRSEEVRVCASHRLLRPQFVDAPGNFAHFRVFALCNAGRDTGNLQFELESLAEQIQMQIRLLSRLAESGFDTSKIRIALTMLDEVRTAQVIDHLSSALPDARIELDPSRQAGRGYYQLVCYKVFVTSAQGEPLEISDGGFVDWTQKLLADQKERFLISGMGSERVCAMLGPSST